MEEEISLREIVEIVFQGRKVIAGITLACIVIGAVFSFVILDPVYEAKTILSINQDSQQKSKPGGLEGLVNDLTELPQVNAQSYATQAKTSVVLRSTMERIGIDTKTMPVSAFAQKINISNIKGTDLLEITVKDKDPKMAAAIANTMATAFVNFISDISKNRIDKTIVFLESQVGEEQAKVDENVEKMKIFLEKSPSVTQLEKELETNLGILASLRAQAVEYNIQTRGLTASIEASEKELITLSDKIQLKRSLFDDPVLFQALADKNNTGILSTSELELISEEINPVYVTLKGQIGINKSQLEQYEKQKASVESLINTTVNRIEKIQVDLAEKKTRYNQLEAELNSSIQNYDLFNKKYSETKIVQSVKAGENTMVIVSSAHEPVVPVGPRKMQNIALAAVFGLMFGIFLVVFRNYMVNSNPINVKNSV